MQVKKHMEILGCKVRDKVTGFEGVVTSVTFDLYGCVHVLVHPGLDKEGKICKQTWFDIGRLEKKNIKPVMEVPNFDWEDQGQALKGPAEKPGFYKA